MTHQEASEASLNMPHCSGMHITIRQANKDSENSYYPDYQDNGMGMGGMGGMRDMSLSRYDISSFWGRAKDRKDKQKENLKKLNKRPRYS